MKKYKQHAIHGNGFEREKKKKPVIELLFIYFQLQNPHVYN